ncbi:MAG: LytR family transcriptional regulator [Chloroflexi bacterium]|nr:LytR family transcriptional regulator [Chloroflexota bacterium]
MSLATKRILIGGSLFAAIAIIAACESANTQATLDFQTQVAGRVEASLTAAATSSQPPSIPTTPPPNHPATAPRSDSGVGTTTPPPTSTPEPTLTATPTARTVLDPTLQYFYLTPENTPVTAVPSPVPRIKQEDDIKNILLIGSDKTDTNGGYRADTLIIVSVNKTANTVTLLSIPRDLYVFIPKSRAVMGRINSVINVAKNVEGGPIPLLEQTILYNLGIPIHYYARVDFDSFRAIVNTLGGIDVPVTCDFQDWRLKDPALDPRVEENWELFTLNAGIQHLDGDTALWYARARQVGRAGSGADFDRARRQQEVLRAMFRRAREQNLLPQIPELYQQYRTSVETDMTLGDVLQFVQLALALDDLNIRSYGIRSPYVQGWTTPNDNASVLLPAPDEFYKYIQRVMTAGGSNRVSQTPYSVEIWNGTTWDEADDLAAYRLGLDGLRVSIGSPDRTDYASTLIIDYTTSPKGSPIKELQKTLHVADASVLALPDENSPVQFRVVLGADYNPCSYQVAPVVTLTPTPTAAPPTPEGTPTPSP